MSKYIDLDKAIPIAIQAVESGSGRIAGLDG